MRSTSTSLARVSSARATLPNRYSPSGGFLSPRASAASACRIPRASSASALNNAISTAAAQDLVDLCVDQPTLDNQFCANVGRDPATGFVNDYLVGPANVAQFATSGADFTINYTVPTETMGTFNLRLAGGYLDKLTFVPTPGADVDVDTEESYAPRWNGTLDLTWAMDNVTINYGLNYFSKTRRYTTEQITANPDLVEAQYVYFRPRVEHDVQLSLKTDDQRFTFYTGVNNVFDR